MTMRYRVVGRTHKLYDHVVQGGWKDTHTLYDHVVQGGWKDTHTI